MLHARFLFGFNRVHTAPKRNGTFFGPHAAVTSSICEQPLGISFTHTCADMDCDGGV